MKSNGSNGQVVYIHGGDCFASLADFYAALNEWSYDPYAEVPTKWKDWLNAELVDRGYDWLAPSMPNKHNADCTAWKIWFEKLTPYLKSDSVNLIGYSLGGSFLVKYLTTTDISFKIKQLHLVAPAVTEADCPGLGEFASNSTDWPKLAKVAKEIHIYHSTDDEIVPFSQSEQLAEALPTATLHSFTDRGHFFQSELPELLKVFS